MVDPQLPFAFHLIYLAILLALASRFVSKFIAFKYPESAKVLERLSAFFVLTGFFIAISIPFPLSLKIFSLVLYAICLLAMILCYGFHN